MWIALISAIAGAGELVIDKIALSRDRIKLSVFLPAVFIFLFFFTLILAPWFGHINYLTAHLPSTYFLLLLCVVSAISSNVLYYQSLQRETAHHNELIIMTLPLMNVILATLFVPDNFSWPIFILAMVASVSLIIARGEKEHFFIDPASYNAFLSVVLMGTENVIIRELLYSFSPVALYAIRTFFVALFFIFYHRPRYAGVTFRHWKIIGLSAVVGMVQILTKYYAYTELGMVYTSLLTALGPALVFVASWEILHERIRPRVVVSAVVILICVIVASVVKFS